MIKIAIRKISFDDLRNMNLFSDTCGSKPRDCFDVNGTTIFITEKGMTAKAIGKDGANVKKLNQALNRDVKVIETADTVEQLVRNYIYPIKAKDISNEHGTIEVKFPSARERRVVLNNNQKELKKLKLVIQRYYSDIIDVRIL